MKRSVLVTLVIGLAVTSVWAQPASWNMPTVGVMGGINIARMTQSPSNGNSNKDLTFGAAGLTSEFSVVPSANLSIRTDLLWNKTGGKITNGPATAKYRVDEIVLAPFAVYRVPMQHISPFIMGGPFLGYDASHRYSFSGSANGVGDIQNWNKTNFGLNAGLGFSVPAYMGAVTVDGRYGWGLTNRYNGAGNVKQRTQGVQVLAGYDFSIPGMK